MIHTKTCLSCLCGRLQWAVQWSHWHSAWGLHVHMYMRHSACTYVSTLVLCDVWGMTWRCGASVVGWICMWQCVWSMTKGQSEYSVKWQLHLIDWLLVDEQAALCILSSLQAMYNAYTVRMLCCLQLTLYNYMLSMCTYIYNIMYCPGVMTCQCIQKWISFHSGLLRW